MADSGYIKPEDSSSEKNVDSPDVSAIILENDTVDAETRVTQLSKELDIDERKLMWKIDLWVVPPFCLLYFLSFLDRVNISNAKLYGLSEDLNLQGNQYNIALTVFFIPYVVFELVGNYVIKIIRPRFWLAGCILVFGALSIGMGFVTNFGGLVACRFLIGVSEASTFPAIFYILSTYYSKIEAQRRFSLFFSVTALAGAASGAIAYRVNEMDGVRGIESWRWLFILEGAATCACAFVLLFLIPDFPEAARFLNQNERNFIKKKLEIFSGSGSAFEVKNKVSDVVKCIQDYLIYIPGLVYFGLIIPSYGYAYFAATIIKQMGYTAVRANEMSTFPWVCAFVVINIFGFLSDKFRRRLPFFLTACVIAIVGLAMVLGATENPVVRYVGCFFTASGLYTAMPLIVCWASLNNGSHIRKGCGSAFQIGFGNIGGIIATFIFLSKDAPVYRPGLATSISAVCFAIVTGLVYFYVLRRLNHLKKTDEYQKKFYAQDERTQAMAGDRAPTFEYLY